ncbi:MAG: aminotransferase class IV [bacterium]
MRIDQSQSIHFPVYSAIRLSEIPIPAGHKGLVYKYRIIYGADLEKTEFIEYTPRPIERLKLVEANDLEYSYKYLDRSAINALLSRTTGKEDIIIIKNGVITDTSFTNLAFFTGSKWLTPASPLLQGTCRKRLIHEGRLIEEEIVPKDLVKFRKVSLINAMLDLDEWSLPMHRISG